MIDDPPVRLSSVPIEKLRGVGPRTAARLRERGISTVSDVLYFCPVSYVDRRTVNAVKDAKEGERSSFVGRIVSFGPVCYRKSRKKGFKALLEDTTGSIFLCWFNSSGPYLKNLLARQGNFFVSGTVARFGGQLQLTHPYVAFIENGQVDEYLKVVPVYSEVQGIGQSTIRKLIREAFDRATAAGLQGLIPKQFEKDRRIMPFSAALAMLHFPEAVEESLLTAAHERLTLEEFFCFQGALFLKRMQFGPGKYASCLRAGRYSRLFLKSLSFKLTAAQKRVIKEIEEDMTRYTPMNRLLQGDVGCGKTLCIVFAACLAMDNGFQVALMAPTEILAEQHYLSIRPALMDMGIEAVLLTSSVHGRGAVLDGLRKGRTSFVVGTHALIKEEVLFSKLGLIVIDEQHKFGVLQRKAIIDKAVLSNVLAVTATPIPRTLSLVFYGHLDVSIIDELPPGRLPIKTLVWDSEKKEQAYNLVLDELKRGAQAYLVFPVIEEREEDGLRGLMNQFEELSKGYFQGIDAELLHGRLSVDKKERVMKDFREGKIRLLACTTVIEVGLNLPDAAVIVVHNAERFGLAQLHQLRGRVGRGTRPSTCILLTGHDGTEVSRERLRIMEETADGFLVAEADMALRGPGEVLGLSQSGLPRFRAGNVVEDRDVMYQARDMVRQVLPGLTEKEFALMKEAIIERWGRDLGLAEA